MLRRNIRLRREYLYRKSLEGKERLLYEKKRKIKEALDGTIKSSIFIIILFFLNLNFKIFFYVWLLEGKPIPTELRNEEAALRQEIDLEDDYTAGTFIYCSNLVFWVLLWVKDNTLFFYFIFPYWFMFYALHYWDWCWYNTAYIVGFLVPKTHIDDEYANATERNPKILLTSSRDPSAPLVQFVKVGLCTFWW